MFLYQKVKQTETLQRIRCQRLIVVIVVNLVPRCRPHVHCCKNNEKMYGLQFEDGSFQSDNLMFYLKYITFEHTLG